MEYGASSEDIARTCHAHPTLSEVNNNTAPAAAAATPTPSHHSPRNHSHHHHPNTDTASNTNTHLQPTTIRRSRRRAWPPTTSPSTSKCCVL